MFSRVSFVSNLNRKVAQVETLKDRLKHSPGDADAISPTQGVFLSMYPMS